MKFAHIADVHLGREQFNQPFRYQDYVRAFRESIEKSVEERVDFILIAGDLFHVSKPSPKALRDAVDILSVPREKGIPVFAIEGNHDKTIRDTSVFDLLEHLGLIYKVGLGKEPRESEFQRSKRVGNAHLTYGVVGDVEVYGLRHHSRWQLIRGEKNLLKALFHGKENAVLMLHQAVDYLSADTPYAQAFDLHLNELPDGFSYYALGHIHSSRLAEPSQTGMSGEMAYPGSPERSEVREASHRITYRKRLVERELKENRKGFYIVEDFHARFVEVETRPFYAITVSGSSKEEFRKKLREIAPLLEKDSIAVVTLEGTVRGGLNLSEVQDVFDESPAAYFAFHSKVTTEAVSSAGSVTEEEMFNEWEREVLRHLMTDPKEFREELDGFISWLEGEYSRRTDEKPPEEKPKQEKQAEKGKAKVVNSLRVRQKGRIDAWFGGGRVED